MELAGGFRKADPGRRFLCPCPSLVGLARAELPAQHDSLQPFGAANGWMAQLVNLAQALTLLGVGLLFTWIGGTATRCS